MKRVATEKIAPGLVACPFCGHRCDRLVRVSWCSGCYVEYYVRDDGKTVFDNAQRTDRLAFGKALQKAGGIRIGAVARPDAGKE